MSDVSRARRGKQARHAKELKLRDALRFASNFIEDPFIVRYAGYSTRYSVGLRLMGLEKTSDSKYAHLACIPGDGEDRKPAVS